MILATQSDVETRLGRDLTDSELERLPGLLEEASAIVEGYLHYAYPYMAIIPTPVVIVVSRMVARAFTTTVPEGVTQQSEAAGPYQHSSTFGAGASNLWLSRVDKLTLSTVGGGASSVSFTSERGGWPDQCYPTAQSYDLLDD